MRRQSLILWTFFALFLATFSPIRAQESADENAGIMLTATDGVAFKSLEALARDYCGYASSSPSGFSLTYYELGLFDLPDPGVYDCWLFAYGFLSKVESNGTITAAGGKLGQLVVIRLANGSWATTSEIGTVNVASGYWPVYFRISDGDLQGVTFYGNENLAEMSYNDAWEFMESFRLFIAAAQDLPITDSVITSLYDFPRLRDFDIYDHDNGGVSDLIEWVRGGNVSNFVDDVPSPDSDCKCGACCVCRCECGLWAGNEECGLPDNCNCHQPDDPENPDDEECACANYCCACTCECEKCGDGEHSAHKNDNGECDGTFEDCSDCHDEENPDDEKCSCANYCCACTCECKKCKAAGSCSGVHKNGGTKCDGVSSDAPGGSTYECSCHKTDDPENPDDEDCTCANYCCACTCECKKCKAAGSCSGVHKNGGTKCDGVASGAPGGSTYCCSCHASTNPEETPCTCANYCCYHTCECKRCASLPAVSHSQHKNGYPTCNGATGSGGCSCHKDDFPEGEAPTVGRNDTFIENSEFDKHYRRLLDALEQKFNISFFKDSFGAFQGDAKLPVYTMPRIFDRTSVEIDVNKAAESQTLLMLRGVLVATLYFYTFTRIFHSLRKLAG